METTEGTRTGHTGRATGRVDRALTVGGYVTSPDGRYKGTTAGLYAKAWGRFETWCRSSGLTPMPATPETVASYVAALLDQGYVPGTVRSRITAIRARHRQLGHPVPDNLAAWGVLRGADHTRRRPEAKGITRTDLIAAIETCSGEPIGVRNRAIALLAWDLLVPAPTFAGLNIADVADGGQWTTIRADGRDVQVHHDHDPVGLCPACAVREWIATMAGVGITGGALFRPVDRFGTIAGCGIRRSGSTRSDSRLTVRSVHRIWNRMAAEAGIPPCTPRSLRIGGARDRIDRGEDLGDVLDRADWSPTTASVVNRLLPTH